MKISIEAELIAHLLNLVNDQVLTDDNVDEWHHLAFNEDYYIVGCYQAKQWLKEHDVDAFEAIADVIEWEDNVFGEVNLKAEDCNSEKIVNLYVYIKGEELIGDLGAESVEELRELLEG